MVSSCAVQGYLPDSDIKRAINQTVERNAYAAEEKPNYKVQNFSNGELRSRVGEDY